MLDTVTILELLYMPDYAAFYYYCQHTTALCKHVRLNVAMHCIHALSALIIYVAFIVTLIVRIS